MGLTLPPPLPTDRVVLTREALASGLDKQTIRRLVSKGEWHRVRRGAYCAAALWERCDAQGQRRLVHEAVYRQAKTPVLLSHTSALDMLGVPVWDMPSLTHLTRPDGRAGRREAGVVPHHGALVVDDVTMLDGRWQTSGTRTALDCMTIADTEHSLVITNGLLRAGATTRELMERRLQSMVHWPGTLHSELVLRLANSLLESIGEDRTWFFFWTSGLPMPIPQYPIRDRSGRIVARVDFAWPELGVFLEFDGKVKYEGLLRDGERASDVVVREKRREDMIRGLTGWRCIRITWADLLDRDALAGRIRAFLAAGPLAS